jgi:hypothetical protein
VKILHKSALNAKEQAAQGGFQVPDELATQWLAGNRNSSRAARSPPLYPYGSPKLLMTAARAKCGANSIKA